MAYRVAITSRAERDLVLLDSEINAAQSLVACQWYFGLKDAILCLRDLPNRNPTTPENKLLGDLQHGHKPHVYRVLFRVKSKLRTVEVLHIRHGARRPFRNIEML